MGLNRLTTTRVAGRSVGRNAVSVLPEQAIAPLRGAEAHSIKVAEAVKCACRQMKVLVAAVLEAFVNVKLERTIYRRPYVWPPRNRKARQLCKVFKTRTSSAGGGVGRGCGCNVGRHGVCCADAVFGYGRGNTRGVGGWSAAEDGGSVSRGVAGTLPGVYGEVGAAKLKGQVVS
jgi:hypothetical protein